METYGHYLFTDQVDEYDNPVKRTKFTHPYSYDGFVVYRGGENNEANNTVWSDRLRQWDGDKYGELVEKHFNGQVGSWSGTNPEDVESFLSEYIGKDIKLILIMEYCNQSSGYPVWRFDYKEL